MTNNYISTISYNATYGTIYNIINEEEFCSSVISEDEGLYKINKALSINEFAACAKFLLSKRFKEKTEVITSTEMCKLYFATAIATYESECFAVLFLNSNHCVIAYEIVALGTINRATIYPRVIAKKALTYNAASAIVAHNHPSDSIEPSEDDLVVIKRLHDTLALIDVRLLDHIIVTNNGKALSFVEEKIMP